jgi:hypothetical protein
MLGEHKKSPPKRPSDIDPIASPAAPKDASLKFCRHALLDQQFFCPGQSDVIASAAWYAICDVK